MAAFTAKNLLAIAGGVVVLLAALLSGAWFFSFFDVLAPWYDLLGIEVVHQPTFSTYDAARGLLAMTTYGLASFYATEYVGSGQLLRSSAAGGTRSATAIHGIVYVSLLVFYVVVAGWGWALLGQHWYSPIAGVIVAHALLVAIRSARNSRVA